MAQLNQTKTTAFTVPPAGTLGLGWDIERNLVRVNEDGTTTIIIGEVTGIDNIVANLGVGLESALPTTGLSQGDIYVASDTLLIYTRKDAISWEITDLEDKQFITDTNATNPLLYQLTDGVVIIVTITNHADLTNVEQVGSGITEGHVSDQPENIHGIKTFKDEILYHDNDTLKARIYTASDQGRIDLYNVDDEVGLRLSGHSDSYFDAFVAVGHRIPLATLHAKYSSGSEPIMFVESTQGVNTSNGLYVKAGTSALDYCARFDSKAGSPYMRITGEGKLGIGTAAPSEKLNIEDGVLLISNSLDNSSVRLGIGTSSGGYFSASDTTGVNKCLIRSYAVSNVQAYFTAGNIGIGTTSPSTPLDVIGAGTFSSTVTATNFILSSDRALKENISSISNKGIENVELKQFTFKSDKSKRLNYGVIAQDLEKTHPEMVFENSDKMKQVDYTAFLLARIDNLEKRLQRLEA